MGEFAARWPGLENILLMGNIFGRIFLSSLLVSTLKNERTMKTTFLLLSLSLTLLFIFACSEDDNSSNIDGDSDNIDFENDNELEQDLEEVNQISTGCLNEDTEGATSRCLSPTMSDEYYIEQSLKYFDTLDITADQEIVPNYSEFVARWEWPPWLKLTGYGRDTMNSTASILRLFDPSTVPERDCRAFDIQPFGRCYITFEYDERPCPIYEEFTFNDAGEITFIEAWSDLPGMLPMENENDPWAEGDNIGRLSTRVPGLGNSEGLVDLDSAWVKEAAKTDEDLADYIMRAKDQWNYWMEELEAAGDDLYERGCGW